MMKSFSKNSNLCDHNSPTLQTDRQTDRQTTCDSNTALCTKVHRAVKTEIKYWNCFSLIGIFFNTAKLCQCFSIRDVRTSEIKIAVKQCCRWSALFHACEHPWNWNKTLKQPETALAFAHDETEIKPTVDGRLKRRPDRRQFCFISVLFHHVRRV